jgi:uncharacterized protein
MPTRSLTSAAAMLAALACVFVTASAAGEYVFDGAHMLKPETIAGVNARVDQLQAQSGKTVTVITVDTTGGVPVQDAAAKEAQVRHLNGAIIYIARKDRQLSIAYGARTSEMFPEAIQTSIKQAMRASFRAGEYDAGVTTGVNAISDIIAQGQSGGHGAPLTQPVQRAPAPAQSGSDRGWLWWLVLLVVGFLLIRMLFRPRAPTMPPGQYPPGQSPPGTSPPGAQSGGMGSFVPGLLGGAAGAYLGSELANRNRDDGGSAGATPIIESGSGSAAPDDGGGFSDAGGGGDFGGGDAGGGGGDGGGGW